jgi:hypothetical protein
MKTKQNIKSLTKEEENFLLKIAAEAIKEHLLNNKKIQVKESEVPAGAKTAACCFVTLRKDGELRGCIGSLTTRQPLYLDVIDNAINAGFKDPRFFPLEEDDLDDLKISISVLSPTRPISFNSPLEIITYFEKNKCGAVIKNGKNQATYLPSVWKELPDVRAFLGSLCEKAGLSSHAWQDKGTTFEVFDAQVFGEE